MPLPLQDQAVDSAARSTRDGRRRHRDAWRPSSTKAAYVKNFTRTVRRNCFEKSEKCWCPRRCSPSRATKSKSRAFIPAPASSVIGWKAKTRLSASEMRGYKLFNDPKKANCAGCHVDQAGQGQSAAAVHRPSVRGAWRTAQYRTRRHQGRVIFRPRRVRAPPH